MDHLYVIGKDIPRKMIKSHLLVGEMNLGRRLSENRNGCIDGIRDIGRKRAAAENKNPSNN